jgi:hypothetical protein
MDLRHHGAMQRLPDLYLIVDKFASLLPNLNLDGDEQEEYSTMLLRLQNKVEGGTPNQTFVDRCLEYLSKFPFSRQPADALIGR